MKIDAALIQRFLKKQCSIEEARHVSNFLKQHPEIAEQYLGKEEWEAPENELLPGDEVFASVWEKIKRKMSTGAVAIMWLRRATVAAAVIVPALLVYRSVNPGEKEQAVAVRQQQENLAVTYKNETRKLKEIQLPDSSLVTLYPASAITYYRKTFVSERNLSLEGQALFEVKASKTRPFTVYSNQVYTTAVGTRFLVTAYDSLQYVRVNLYRGKVHVAVHKPEAGAYGRYDMIAGNVLYVDRAKGIVNLSNEGMHEEKTKENTTIKERMLVNWYSFDNAAMANVFDQLAIIYNVRIHYNKNEIKGLNYISRIERGTPLDQILQDIATVNNLTITKNNGAYVISKK